MIIEFIGIPGSGKTHISHMLCNYLESQIEDLKVFHNDDILKEIKIDGRIRHLIILFPFIFNIYFLSLIYKILTRKNSSIASKKKLIRIFLQRILIYSKINKKVRNNNYLYVLDEGLLHFSIAFFRQNKELPEGKNLKSYLYIIKKIINYNTKDKIYIFVDSDIEENYKRIENRKSGWPGTTAHLTDIRKKEYLKDSYKYYSSLRDNKDFYSKSIIIDNSVLSNDYSQYFNSIIKKIRENQLGEI